MTIENESKRPLDGSLKWGGNTYKFGYNSGYKRDGVFSSLEFQRLYASDFFESHVLRQKVGPEMKVSGLFYCSAYSDPP